jgi:hypothetical protein
MMDGFCLSDGAVPFYNHDRSTTSLYHRDFG